MIIKTKKEGRSWKAGIEDYTGRTTYFSKSQISSKLRVYEKRKPTANNTRRISQLNRMRAAIDSKEAKELQAI